MFDNLFGWRKASKCKELIESVQGRLKLLKRRRACIVNLLREDASELLKLGHHQPAFLRMHQIEVDQNMVELYRLVHHVCESVITSLPCIRRRRDCPDAMSEAVSTLIFLSSRLGELPELLPLRQLFQERYGETPVEKALELLPGNHVSIQIKERLEMKNVADQGKCRILDQNANSFNEIEEFKAAVIKDGNQQDQRVFIF